MSYYDSCCNPCCCNPCCNPCQSNPCCSCNCGGSAASGTQPAFICANGTMNDFASARSHVTISFPMILTPCLHARPSVLPSFLPAACAAATVQHSSFFPLPAKLSAKLFSGLHTEHQQLFFLRSKLFKLCQRSRAVCKHSVSCPVLH